MRRPFGLPLLALIAVTAVRSSAQSRPVTLVTDVRPASDPTPARDSSYASVVMHAQSAAEAQRWATAASLWRDALETNALVPAHWNEYGHALYLGGQYREAVAAFQRAIQLDNAGAATGAWNVARAYAQAGNQKQAYRWLERAFDLGLRPRTLWREEPAFARYRDEPSFRALVESMDTQHTETPARAVRL